MPRDKVDWTQFLQSDHPEMRDDLLLSKGAVASVRFLAEMALTGEPLFHLPRGLQGEGFGDSLSSGSKRGRKGL